MILFWRRRPHLLTYGVDQVRGVIAFLVGHGINAPDLAGVMTAADGLITQQRAKVSLRIRFLKDCLRGSAMVRLHAPLAACFSPCIPTKPLLPCRTSSSLQA